MRLSSVLAGAAALALVHAAGSTSAAAQVRPAEGDAGRSIEVTGEASIETPPDFATITLGVTTTAKDAGAALTANAKAANELVAALKGEGVAPTDIQTSSLSVSPAFSNPAPGSSTPPSITGYTVGNMVTVTVHDLSRLGALIDKATASGANAMYGVAFGVTDPGLLLDKARPLAFADAKRKAEIYAVAAGAKLGPALELSEQVGQQQFPRRPYVSAARAVPTPIEAGQDKLTVTVTARFELTE